MKIDTMELSPWADVHRMLSNMRSLTVKVGKTEHSGAAELEDDGTGNVTLSFKNGRRSKKDNG